MTSSSEDQFLKPFLNEDFNENDYTSSIIQGQDVSLCMRNIQEHIQRLDNDLKQHVNIHHQDLLSQAVGIEKLESVLDLMLTRTATLVNGVAKIQRKVQEPCANLEGRVKQLERMQITCEVLRKTLRIVYLTARLQGQVKDISKASATINELEYLFNTVSWNGIEVLEKNRRITQHIREDLERQAWSMVSLSTHNQSQFGLALQVFHNLNCLPKVLRKLLTDWLQDFKTALHSVVDVESLTNLSANKKQSRTQGPGRATIPSAGQASAFRAALWTQIDRLLDQFYQTASKMKLLLKILGKKRDINMSQRTLLHCLLLDLHNCEDKESTDKQTDSLLANDEIRKFLGGPDNVNESRWSPEVDKEAEWSSQSGGYFVLWAAERMRDKFECAIDQSSFFKQAFEGEYPKLVKLSLDLGQRLTDLLPSLDTDESYLKNENQTTGSTLPLCFWVFLTPLENAYLSRSLSRLMDPVELAFSSSVSSPTTTTVPNNEEVDCFVKIVCNELTLASVEESLLKKVARNVSKSIHLLVTKAEQILVVSGEASQVVAPPTIGQQLNIRLINCLQIYRNSIEKALHQQLRLSVNSPVLPAIAQSLQELTKLMEAGVEPLLQSITDSLQAIILTMHQENFSNGSQTSSQCSLYMQELADFSSRVKAQYLVPFSCSQLIHQCLLKQQHLPACLESFLIQASLLRDLSDDGKFRLASDCSHLEKALSNLLCGPIQDMGTVFKRLRAFKPLLYQSTELIFESPSIGSDSLPYSMVLHHLFSRAPLDLQSPHVSAGWSITRYTQWLVDHPDEKDKLHFIKGSLDAYAQTVRLKGQKEYIDIYPRMVDLLQKGMKISQQSG